MAALKNTHNYVEINLQVGTSPADIFSDEAPVMKKVLEGGFKATA